VATQEATAVARVVEGEVAAAVKVVAVKVVAAKVVEGKAAVAKVVEGKAAVARVVAAKAVEGKAAAARVVAAKAAAKAVEEKAAVADEPSATARLSLEAIRYGFGLLPGLAHDQLWTRLYFFNRLPYRGTARADEHSENSAAETNRLQDETAFSRLTRLSWKRRTDSDPNWFLWERAPLLPASRRARERNGYFKVYVSPATASLKNVLAAAVDVATECGCATMKIGASPRVLARPDKIVLYTDSWEHTEEVGSEIARRAAAALPHGVPFTTDLSGDGLVSWAIDPHVARSQHPSWRLWITFQIASLMAESKLHDRLNRSVEQVLNALATRHGLIPGTWAIRPGFRQLL
jgi:hypothetical protein